MYRVIYPLITTDGHRDFATRGEAEAFARARREICDRSPYMTKHSWRLVHVTEIAAPMPSKTFNPPAQA